MRRRGAQFRLSAWHVGARHGGRCRPSPRIYRDGGTLVQNAHEYAGDCEAHAQHHRYSLSRPRCQKRWRRCGVAHQHDLVDHVGRSRPDVALACGGRTRHAWRLLRSGGKADCAQYGGRDRPRCRNTRPADFRHWRRNHMERRRRFYRDGRGQCAGLHRSDDLWLQDRRGNDLGPLEIYGREGLSDDGRFPWLGAAQSHGLAISQFKLRGESLD